MAGAAAKRAEVCRHQGKMFTTRRLVTFSLPMNTCPALQRLVVKLGSDVGGLMEVINCHDCKRAVSFSANSCPHCGSTEPAGPYRFSKREARNFRIEDRNDNYLVKTTLLLGLVGTLYGVVVGQRSESNWYGVHSAIIVMSAVWYGLIGVLIGVPVAAAINMYRSARYFLIPTVLVLLFLAYEFGFLRLQ
jgi:hypothetical protein